MGISILLTLLVLALLAFLAMMPGIGRRGEMAVMRTSYAHRGLHTAARPENSPSAFAAAIETGYGIELDVRLTADGVPVIFHDNALRRICACEGTVSTMTLAQLRRVRLGGGNETLPTLAEVLGQVAGQVPLLIEIKGEDGNTDICAQTAELLDNYDGVFSVQSFNPLYLAWFKQNRPAYIRGLLYTNFFKEKNSLSFFRRLTLSGMLLNFLARPDFIAYNQTFPAGLSLWLCRDIFQVPCFVWTVRSETALRRVPSDVSIIFEGFTPTAEPYARRRKTPCVTITPS